MIERMLHLLGKYPLNGLSHLCSILPILVGLFNYRYLSRGLRLLLLLFAIYFVHDSYSLWLSVYRKSTFAVQNLQPLWETILIALIYLTYFQSHFLRKMIRICAISCAVIIVFTFRVDSISPVSSTIQKLFVTAMALTYLNEIVQEARIKNIVVYSMFWISAAFLIYSAGTFFVSLFSTYLYADITSSEVFDTFWNLSQILYILFTSLAAIGIRFATCDRNNFV
jgi:hypothetical protein